MKYSNKMVLVPHDTVSKIKDTDKTGLEKTLDEYKTELKRILNDESLSSEDQVKIYSQLFSKFIKFDRDNQQPPVIFTKTAEPESSKAQPDPELESIAKPNIIKGLPKGRQNQANLLVDYLKGLPNFKVNQNGEIMINEKTVPNTNFIDLVHDFIRDRPKAIPPRGADSFASFLRSTNVPKEYIGNPIRWRLINKEIIGETPEKLNSVKRRIDFDPNNTNSQKKSKKKTSDVTYLQW